ncbi:ankyrin repeat-containing domain protein [Xylaria longipes]|nr:ankyrin repeat-containing domain protein [Xylaria longipes]
MAKVIPNASPTTFVEGLTVLSDPENAEADVVFVHGLQGDPYLTWTCDVKTHREKPQMNQRQRPQHTPQFLRCFFCSLGVEDDDDIFWLKDLLAEEPWSKSVRILTYGYDSKVTKRYAAANQNNLFAHAKDFLYKLQREKPSRRPIIFVVHSLGGIVVKETLRRSEASEEDELKDIMRSTKGIIFMGTPHRGSPGLASLGEAVRRVASVIGRVDSNSTLLRSLGTDSPELELGRESFLVLWRTYDFRVKTFQEAHGISGVNVGPANEKLYYNLSTSQRCTGVLLEALRSAKYALEPTYFIPQVQWLLANGADVNVRNQLGRTALHIAATIDVDSDFVREILLYDPDVNAQDNNGETPLHLTGYWTLRPNDIAELLIAHGAGVRIVDNKGDNVLSYLLRCRTSLLNKSLLLAMSQVLVKAGCPLNSKDRQGQTVLHHLVSRMSDFGAARRDGPLAALYVYLYEAGADPMIEDDAGKTPKDILQEQGVDVDAAGALVFS